MLTFKEVCCPVGNIDQPVPALSRSLPQSPTMLYHCGSACNCPQLFCVLVTQLCLTLCNPITVACQASLSMGFSRQEYWSGFPFPSPGNLPDPGIKTGSPTLQTDFLPSKPPGKPSTVLWLLILISNLEMGWELSRAKPALRLSYLHCF